MRRWTVTFKVSVDVEIAVTLNARDIFEAIETASQYYSKEGWTIMNAESYEL